MTTFFFLRCRWVLFYFISIFFLFTSSNSWVSRIMIWFFLLLLKWFYYVPKQFSCKIFKRIWWITRFHYFDDILMCVSFAMWENSKQKFFFVKSCSGLLTGKVKRIVGKRWIVDSFCIFFSWIRSLLNWHLEVIKKKRSNFFISRFYCFYFV